MNNTHIYIYIYIYKDIRYIYKIYIYKISGKMFSESNNEMYKYPTNIQQMSG